MNAAHERWYQWIADQMADAATDAMSAPYRCTRCNHVHDAGKVTVLARYSDCSVWECPNCHARIDDRPIGWGGSAERVTRRRPVGADCFGDDEP